MKLRLRNRNHNQIRKLIRNNRMSHQKQQFRMLKKKKFRMKLKITRKNLMNWLKIYCQGCLKTTKFTKDSGKPCIKINGFKTQKRKM